MRRSIIPFCILTVGCTAEESVLLVDSLEWVAVEEQEDPFDDRPDNAECPPSSQVIEKNGSTYQLEIDTSLCDYVTLHQPTQVAVQAGERIRLKWGHRDLNAGDQATATGHFVFQMGEMVIEDVEISIPRDAEEFEINVEVEEALEAGSDAWLHLHNHGDNQWYFSPAEAFQK